MCVCCFVYVCYCVCVCVCVRACAQELLVLGSQPLSALRDRISCLSDEELSGQETPAGFFFIEGKFYNDLRARNATKLSE